MSNESASKIGSDPKHTAWCQAQASRLIESTRKALGPVAWGMLGSDIRYGLVMAKVAGLILGQDNEESPVWRSQELIAVTAHMFGKEE